MKAFCHFCVALVFLFCFAVPALGDMYTWTDAQGVRHYSNEPPPGAARDTQQWEEIPADENADQPDTGLEELLEIMGAEDTEPQPDKTAAESESAANTTVAPAAETSSEEKPDKKAEDSYRQKQRRRERAAGSSGEAAN